MYDACYLFIYLKLYEGREVAARDVDVDCGREGADSVGAEDVGHSGQVIPADERYMRQYNWYLRVGMRGTGAARGWIKAKSVRDPRQRPHIVSR